MDEDNRTLQSELWARLDGAPGAKALTFVDSRGDFRWQTFEELHAKAAQCASILADSGLRRGDVCVLVLPSDEDACRAWLGCILLSAVPVLIAPPVIRGLHSDLRKVIEYVVRKTAARMLIAGEGAQETSKVLCKKISRLVSLTSPDELGSGDASAVPVSFPPADGVAALQLTSGTTGLPKICVWQQRGVLASLDGMERAMKLASDDAFLNWTPLYHDMGLVNNFLLCMIKRIPLAMIETFEFIRRPALWLRALSLTRATTTWSPNFGYALAAQRIMDRELGDVDLSHVRGFWNAAERIHLQTMLNFQARFERYGVRLSSLKTNFGCAENVGGATFSDPDKQFVMERVDRSRLYGEGLAQPGTDAGAVDIVGVGRPCPGMTVRIMSRNGRVLPDGQVGQVALRTPSRMRGYLGKARDTQRAIRGEYLLTGDLGYLRGQELFWVGRVTERINLHGKKYDPSDFERALLNVDGLRKGCFAAFGVDDVALGTQRLVIVSETSSAKTREDEEIVKEVEGQIAQQLGIATDEVLLLDHGTMSKTSSGKRRHRFYRQQYVDGDLQSLPGARLFKT